LCLSKNSKLYDSTGDSFRWSKAQRALTKIILEKILLFATNYLKMSKNTEIFFGSQFNQENNHVKYSTCRLSLKMSALRLNTFVPLKKFDNDSFRWSKA
jgi:hypothetical protein